MIAQHVMHVLAAAIPDPAPAAPPGVEGKATTVLSWIRWAGLAACVVGLFVAGAQMALNHRRGMGGAEAASQVGWVAIALVVIGAAGANVAALA